MSYQAKPMETGIQNYASIQNSEGLLSKLNPSNSFRGKALGALTAASLLAGCGTAMDIRGRDTATGDEYRSRVGQAPLELTVGRAVYSLIRPANAMIDSKVFDLYTDFKHAVDKVLCKDNGLLEAGKKALQENTAKELYKAGCVDYSEIDTGNILETLNDKEKDTLSGAVKDALNKRLAIVTVASNQELVALPATYVIDEVSIERILHPAAREAGTLVLDAAFWYGVAELVGAVSGGGSGTGAGKTGGNFGGGG